jgi:hypothetical protein
VGGAWSTSAASVANVNLLTGFVSGVAEGNATITYTLLTGCYQTAEVTVNPLPAPVTGVAQVCPGSVTTLSDATAGGTWSVAYSGIADVSASGEVSGIAAGSVSVIYTLPTGCTREVMITVNSLPAISVVTGGGSYCAGGTGVNIGVDASVVGVDYQLYDGAGAVGSPLAGTGASLSFGAYTAVGTYTVAAVDASTGCKSNMLDSAVVTITPINVPAVTVSTGVGDTVCDGNSTTFTAGSTGAGAAASYAWKVNGMAVGLSDTAYSYLPNDGDVVTVTLTSSTPCSVPATATGSFVINVKSNVTPVVSISSASGNSVCKGTTILFNAASTYGGAAPSYDWYVNNSWSGAGSAFGYLPDDGDVVFCRMHSNYMCRLSDSVNSLDQNIVTKDVYIPIVNISVDPGTTIAYGQSATFTATAIGAGPAPTYQWERNGAAIFGATNATYTGSNFATGDSVTCKVTGSGACGFATHNSVVITAYDLSVGSNNAGHASVTLMPNPNKGAFTVKGKLASGKDEEVTIDVTSMLGQSVYRTAITAKAGNIDQQIQLSNTLANGMYMLNVTSGNESRVFHFVLEQ